MVAWISLNLSSAALSSGLRSGDTAAPACGGLSLSLFLKPRSCHAEGLRKVFRHTAFTSLHHWLTTTRARSRSHFLRRGSPSASLRLRRLTRRLGPAAPAAPSWRLIECLARVEGFDPGLAQDRLKVAVGDDHARGDRASSGGIRRGWPPPIPAASSTRSRLSIALDQAETTSSRPRSIWARLSAATRFAVVVSRSAHPLGGRGIRPRWLRASLDQRRAASARSTVGRLNVACQRPRRPRQPDRPPTPLRVTASSHLGLVRPWPGCRLPRSLYSRPRHPLRRRSSLIRGSGSGIQAGRPQPARPGAAT